MKIKLLTGLFLLMVFLTFSSCEKDLQEETSQEQTKQNSKEKIDGKVNYVTIDDVPFLKPTVKKFQAKNKLTARAIEPALELDRIAEYEGADGYVSYSIPIEQPPVESNDYYFENLNIIKNGDQYETFILRYNPDNDAQYLDFSNFTGKTEFLTSENKLVATVNFQNSTARLVQKATPILDESGAGGGGCSCSPSLIERLFDWIGDAIKNVGYAISNISITAYSNAGDNGYNYNPYVLKVTPPDMGTSNNPNYPDPSGGSSTIIVSPNEPEWTATDSQRIMVDRICRRINFDDLSIRNWLLDPSNVGSVKGFYFSLWEENSLENQLFVKQAVESVRMGAEVDLAYRVIVDQSLKNNTNLYGVYTQLGKAPAFQRYIQKFNNASSIANLSLNVDSLFGINYPKNAASQAITLTPKNYMIDIIINNDGNLPSNIMKFPKIISALVFIHEMIHAEINRILLTCSNLPHVNTENMTDAQWKIYIKNMHDNFSSLYNYYVKYQAKVSTPTPYQHEYMAQIYRNAIKEALKQYDGNQHSEDFYETISWFGLRGTTAWNNLSQLERDNINTSLQNIYRNEPYFN